MRYVPTMSWNGRVAVLVILCACGATDSGQTRRYPEHRKLEEQRITDLEQQVTLVKALEKRVHDLEVIVWQLRQPASAPAQ
jgi:hypothetical protein